MNLGELVTDPYNRRARLAPALLALLPVALVALVLFPDPESKTATLFGIAAYFGGAAWLTQIGRERGKRLEPKLFHSWGGMPSMVFLRHRDARISAITKKRYHAFLSAHVPDLSMPSADDEASNPDAADDVYTSATDWLLTATRNKEKFRLVFEENVNYGFRRNLWALRPIAVVVDFALFIAVVALHTTLGAEAGSTSVDLNPPALIALGVIVGHLVLLLRSTKRWVKTAAVAYALQLLAACDALNNRQNAA